MQIPIATDQALNELLESARRLLAAGRLADAEGILRRIVGMVSIESSEPSEESVEQIRAALRLALDLADACCQRGDTLLRGDQFEQGLAALEMAETLKVGIAELHNLLGDAHLRLWEFEDAIVSYRAAARLQPDSAPAAQKLQDALEKQKQPDQVIAGCRARVERFPESAEARLHLANALRAYRRLDEAIKEYQHAIVLSPRSAGAHNNLAIALKDVGRVEESLTVLAHASELAPASVAIQNNLLYALHFHPADDGQSILRAHRAFDEQFARSLTLESAPHANDCSPDRALRVGYVSPDFREHCQSFFTVPLLSHHDRGRFKIFCYANVFRPDALTDRIRGYASVWRDTQGLPDKQVAEMICADGIDILVDLTMHMSNSRALMFARKPAPVQIAWLAYPGTTGLSAMDYRLSDPYLDPPGENDSDYSEQTVRLPQTFWCYDPLIPEEPVAPLPALQNGHITFGCLNNFCKVSDATLEMWRAVLQQVGDARLVLLAPAGQTRQRVLNALQVNEPRVQFVDYVRRPEYLKLYGQIDICLDTFPYNGHTTSLDALWMGVPVVALCGRTAVARAGWSQASNLKLTNLVAQTPEEFVQIATTLAGDLSTLAELRSTLRTRMAESPLMDGRRFARTMESIYRQLWQKWCSNGCRG